MRYIKRTYVSHDREAGRMALALVLVLGMERMALVLDLDLVLGMERMALALALVLVLGMERMALALDLVLGITDAGRGTAERDAKYARRTRTRGHATRHAILSRHAARTDDAAG